MARRGFAASSLPVGRGTRFVDHALLVEFMPDIVPRGCFGPSALRVNAAGFEWRCSRDLRLQACLLGSRVLLHHFDSVSLDRGHALAVLQAGRDLLCLLLMMMSLPAQVQGLPFRDLLPRQGSCFLAMAERQLTAFGLLMGLQGLPSCVFFRPRSFDQLRARPGVVVFLPLA